MENPYEPPKTEQRLRPKLLGIYERFLKYQQWLIYLGLVIMIVSLGLTIVFDSVVSKVLGIIASAGLICTVLALLFTLPMSVWGMIKGFREGRGR